MNSYSYTHTHTLNHSVLWYEMNLSASRTEYSRADSGAPYEHWDGIACDSS